MKNKSFDSSFIRSMNLGNRACRCLSYLQVSSADDLKKLTTSQIKSFPGIGEKTLNEIVKAARCYGVNIYDDCCCKEEEHETSMDVPALAKYDPKSTIDTLGLSFHTTRTLKMNGVKYIKDLISLCPYQVLGIDGCGRYMWEEIYAKVTECGYEFAREDIEDLGLSKSSLGYLRKKELTSIQKILNSLDNIRVIHGRLTPVKIRDEIISSLITKGYLPEDFALQFTQVNRRRSM